jgi:hypothetical protein
MVTDYLENVKVMSKSTALQYEKRLRSFSYFSDQRYKQDIDYTINNIKK